MDNVKDNKKVEQLLQLMSVQKKLGSLKFHIDYYLVVNATLFLPPEASVAQRRWHLLNHAHSIPVCMVCSINQAAWCKEKGGFYRDTCSPKCSGKNPDRANKIKQTNLQKYGSISPFGNARVQEKVRVTLQKKYGVNNISQDPNTNNKIKQALFVRRNKNINKKGEILDMISNHRTQQQIGNALGITQPRVSSLLKKLSLSTKNITTSSMQEEVQDFIKTLIPTATVIVNEKRLLHPYHIDIYIPERNLAFEINGVFWHGEGSGKGRQYHLQKTLRCDKEGVRLIHIFSSEWACKREIVKSRIATLLHSQQRKLFARNGCVKIISAQHCNAFVNKHHLQGARAAKINIGLYISDELVAIMSFAGHKKYEYELIRFCCLKNYIVVGGAGKLFQYFIKQYSPQSVLSYADRRWSNGHVYKQLGFLYSGATQPNYWYFNRQGDTNKLFSRNQFQKHKLRTRLKEGFNPAMTEWDNMKSNNYDRIWDCGSMRWVWKK